MICTSVNSFIWLFRRRMKKNLVTKVVKQLNQA